MPDTPPGQRRPSAEPRPKARQDGSGSKRAQPPRARAAADLNRIEARLNEMFATVAVLQSAAGVATGDPRHGLGGKVTAELSPSLVRAWIGLAKESEPVRKVLIRLSESTAWGEVAIVSAGFVYSQAQAYQILPAAFPNPWVDITPVSDEVNDHAAAQDGEWAVPFAVDTEGEAVVNDAEADRRRVEAMRRKQAQQGQA